MLRPFCLLLLALSLVVLPGLHTPLLADDDGEADVVYVPTPYDVVTRMLKMAKVEKKDVLYDLGCGDGRIVVTAARKKGCKGVGFDINPVRIKESLANVKKNRVEKLVKIEKKDIFTLDLSKASVIALYLLPELNLRLVPQFNKMKPGSRIVSHDYGMEGYKTDKTISFTSREDGGEHTLYLWTVPLKKTTEKTEKKKSD